MTVILKPKIQVGNESQIQQETVAKANIEIREQERLLIKKHDTVDAEENIKHLKSKNIYAEIGGTFDDRMAQSRTIHLTMTLDKRPEVIFTGFWNGKFIQAAMNAIARQYRQRRIVVAKTLGGTGDGRTN